MEDALGDLGEDGVHRVLPVLRGEFSYGEYVGPVLGELPSQEEVHEVDLAHNVDEVQQLAQEESGGKVCQHQASEKLMRACYRRCQ